MSSKLTAEPVTPPATPPPAKKRPRLLVYLARVGAGSLFLSIAVHVAFVIIAALYVVSIVGEKRKVAFTGGGAGDGSGGAAAEVRHQVSVARQNTTPVPTALSQKIVVDGAASVALPELPTLGMPASAISSSAGATGSLGGGLGSGAGTGSGVGTGTGALRMMPFGLLQAPKSGALVGTLYLMPSDQYKNNKEETAGFQNWIRSTASSGWPESSFAKLPKSPKQLFTTQILIPQIVSLEAPKAFGVDKQKSVVRFLIRYRGKVSPPRNGRWRFVGFGDDILIVRLSSKVVLVSSGPKEKKPVPGMTGWTPHKFYNYGSDINYAVGDWLQLNTSGSYDLEIYMSEEPRSGNTSAILLVEEEGATYEKTAGDAPILPPWTLAPNPVGPSNKMSLPLLTKDAPVWISRGM